MLFRSATSAGAWSITLAWDAPTKNADGTPLTDLQGYRVYMHTAPIPDNKGNATLIAEVPAGQDMMVVDTGAPAGVYYWRVSAIDTSGNESALSNEESRDLSDLMPPEPVRVRIEGVTR